MRVNKEWNNFTNWILPQSSITIKFFCFLYEENMLKYLQIADFAIKCIKKYLSKKLSEKEQILQNFGMCDNESNNQNFKFMTKLELTDWFCNYVYKMLSWEIVRDRVFILELMELMELNMTMMSAICTLVNWYFQNNVETMIYKINITYR